MKEQDIEQAAEIAGVAKELFKAFEDQLGEVMATQRLASNEANQALAETRRALRELLDHAKTVTEGIRQSQEELRRAWQFHVAENSKAAGAEMALKFGEEIAAGLERRLVTMTEAVERATQRFEWVSALRWGSGIAVGIALTIAIGVWALVPSVDGLSTLQVRAAMTRLAPCQVGQEMHVCIWPNDKPRFGKGVNDDAVLVVVRGM